MDKTARSRSPNEIDPEVNKARSAPEMQLYYAETTSNDPMKSVLENNPEVYPAPPKRGADWGNWEFEAGAYYDQATPVGGLPTSLTDKRGFR